MSPHTFKVGDKIRCISHTYDSEWSRYTRRTGCIIGETYTVTHVPGKGLDTVGWVQLKEFGTQWAVAGDFELATETEVPCENNPNIKMIQTFVPIWAKYMAMDKFGAWFVFSEEPVVSTGKSPDWRKKGGNPVDEKTPRFRCKIGECDPDQIEVDWKETLHEV